MKKLLILILCLICISCKSHKEIVEIPVEVIKTEYKDIWHFDSIYLKENVYVYQKGDTIFRDSTHIKYIEKQVYDTIRQCDTIQQPVYITQTKVVKEPQWWPVWLIVICAICFGIIYSFNKFKFR